MIILRYQPKNIPDAFDFKNLVWSYLKQDQSVYIDFGSEVYVNDLFYRIFMQLYLHFDRDYLAKKLIPLNLTELLKNQLKEIRDEELSIILPYLEVVKGISKQKPRSKKYMVK